ncbi:MAG TPA: TolC family protein, partial [Thermodesulfobacteriota bacterium]
MTRKPQHYQARFWNNLNLSSVLFLMANFLKTLTFLLPLLLLASEAAAEPLTLPFRQGLSMLFENNLELGVQRLAPRIADARVMSAQGFFDPELFGSFSRQDTSTPLSARSSVAAGGLRSVESEAYELDAGLTGRTAFGTEYTLQVLSNWTADTFSGFEYEYDSFTGVSVRQPLLRDYGGANLLEIRLARKDREISVQQTRRVLLDAVSAYGDAWWALAEARGALDVRLESLKFAEVLLEANRKKLEAGVISRLDLVQAQAAVASRKEDV